MATSQLKIELHQTIDGLSEKKLRELKKVISEFLGSMGSKSAKVKISEGEEEEILSGIKDFENGNSVDAKEFLKKMKKKYV